MDLNPRQQKLAFAVIVVMLAGLGIYLILPAATAGQHGSVAPTAPAGTGPPQTAPPALRTATVAPPVTPSPSAGGAVDIYQLLPFTQSDLDNAAAVATQAAAGYDTYGYTDTAAAYGARMSGLVTSQYLQALEAGFATFGVAQQRTRDQEVSSASAAINSLRSFGASSLTFVVTISQQIKNVRGATTSTGQFAITAISTGGEWQVNQIQPASAGNQ
jgi:hypothetical protein